MIRFLLLLTLATVVPTIAAGQGLDPSIFQTPVDGSVASWLIRTFGLLTVLSIAPGILIMVTQFPRFIIAFAFCAQGWVSNRTCQHDSGQLSVFMTFIVMSPTFDPGMDEGLTRCPE